MSLATFGCALVVLFFAVREMVAVRLDDTEYNFLKDLYYSTNGPHWTYEKGVQLDYGPWKFISNEAYNPCKQLWYGLLCIGFDNFNGLGKLMIVNMTGVGNMTGTLPPLTANFSQLLYFVLTEKQEVQGPPPSFIATDRLQVLNLTSNALTGTIPDCWTGFLNLQFLSFANNRLQGEIPSSIYDLESMQYISFFNNSLSGTISHLIADMINLLSFNIGYNRIGGQLPTFIRTMGVLEQFLVENNRLTGHIPMQLPPALRAVQLSNNFLTGPIPASLCAASNLTVFTASSNRLTGTMPQCFGFFTELAVLQLQANMMGGPIRGIFDPFTSTKLWVLDITDNAFTGSFPAELFHLPGLISLAASKNCFSGSLPESLCNASQTLQVVALDGLQSGSRCALRPWDPLNLLQGYVTTLMEGTVPSCVWTMPHLRVLHLAGNGFGGTLPPDVSLPPTLTSVSLTHNEMEGTVPANFAAHPFHILDLSFNNFEGSVTGLDAMPFARNASDAAGGATLSLQVNRFSGRLPSAVWEAWNVNVLNGNLFTCAQNRHDLPRHDPEAADYFCGSMVFDNAAALFGLVFLVVVLPALLLLFGPASARCLIVAPTEVMMKWLQSAKTAVRRQRWEEPVWVRKARLSCLFTLRYVLRVQVWTEKTPEEIVDTPQEALGDERGASDDPDAARLERWGREQQMRKFGNFYRYVAALTLLRRLCLAVCAAAVVLFLPLYLLFYQLGDAGDADDGQQFSTVQRRYSWVTTSAFLAGEVPAGSLFALFVAMLWLLSYGVARHFNVHLRQRTRRRRPRPLVAKLSFAVAKATDNLRDSAVSFARESFSIFAAPPPSTVYSALHAPSPSEDAERGAAAGVESPPRGSDAETGDAAAPTELLPARKSMSIRFSDPALGPAAEAAVATSPARKSQSQSMRASSLSTLPQRLDEADVARAVTAAELRHFLWLLAAFCGIFLLNLSISIAINAAYLLLQNTSRLSTDAKTVLQLAMAAFKLVWNMVAVRILVSKLPYSRRSAQLHVVLLLTNTVLAPCLAVALTDSSCFKDFFFGASSVCTAYELALCLETSQMYCTDSDSFYTACVRYQQTEFVTEFSPSFIYYYGCSARLLTSYIPVYLYSYTLLLLAVPLGYTLLATLQRRSLPNWVLRLLDGVLRPQDRGQLTFRFLMRPTATQAMLTQHLIVLVTFGVNAPLLAVVMALAIAADTFAWQLLLARYLHFEDRDTPFSPLFLRDAAAPRVSRGSEGPIDAHRSLSKDDYPEQQQSQRSRLQLMVALQSAHDSTTVGDCILRQSMLQRGSLCAAPSGGAATSLSASASASTARDSESLSDRPSADEEEARERASLLERERTLEARLNELHTVIGRAWRGPRNTMWLVFYCGVLFNAGMLFDVAGYLDGWRHALWLPVAAGAVVVLSRLCFMEAVGLLTSAHRGARRWLQRCLRARRRPAAPSRGSGTSLWGVFGDMWAPPGHEPDATEAAAADADADDTTGRLSGLGELFARSLCCGCCDRRRGYNAARQEENKLRLLESEFAADGESVDGLSDVGSRASRTLSHSLFNLFAHDSDEESDDDYDYDDDDGDDDEAAVRERERREAERDGYLLA